MPEPVKAAKVSPVKSNLPYNAQGNKKERDVLSLSLFIFIFKLKLFIAFLLTLFYKGRTYTVMIDDS
jgi:hypothetical protein